VLIGNVALFNIELRAGVVGFEGEDINTVDNHDATAVLSGSAISFDDDTLESDGHCNTLI